MLAFQLFEAAWLQTMPAAKAVCQLGGRREASHLAAPVPSVLAVRMLWRSHLCLPCTCCYGAIHMPAMCMQ